MNSESAKVQRTYLTLMLFTTLSASLIWGINTLFLLDAGLNNLQAFAANAFFTAGMMLFEVPTGVVADLRGRQLSFLLGSATLTLSTLVYVLLWQVEAPFWAWAVVSVVIGLGFTFFSGAVEAWLVDALRFTGYDGPLDPVFAKAQAVAGGAMLSGSVLGGVIAQVTSLGVPFVVRSALLGVTFVIALLMMKDLGFTPEHGERPLPEMKRILNDSLHYGLGRPAVRWVMLTAPFVSGVSIYAFYAMQPYLLELWGDEGAYGIAGLAAAIVAGAQIVGGLSAPRLRTAVPPPYVADAGLRGGQRGGAAAGQPGWLVLGRRGPAGALGPRLLGHRTGAAGLPQRPDPVAAAGHRAVLRLAARLLRRGRGAAGARAGGGRERLRAHLRAERRHPGLRDPAPGARTTHRRHC